MEKVKNKTCDTGVEYKEKTSIIKNNSKIEYLFVIDTDSYSGNFERQLCAYCTGQIGECGIGNKQAEIWNEEVGIKIGTDPFIDIIQQKSDEHGVFRPVEIYPTPGFRNNGFGKHFKCDDETTGSPAYQSIAIFFNEKPNEEMIKIMKEQAHKFSGQKNRMGQIFNIKILGFRLVKISTLITEETTNI